MSTSEPVPNISKAANVPEKEKSNIEDHQLGSTSSATEKSFSRELKVQIKEWFFTTLRPLLIIVHVTVVFILALLADTLIIMIISWSFHDVVSHNLFAANLLEGIQLLSALGTAAAYILYLIRSIFKDTRHVLEELRIQSGEKEALL